jgi:POT family proton-dependent oligopeptide transporter
MSAKRCARSSVLFCSLLFAKYDQLFVYSAKIGIVCGIVVLVLTPLIKRWMHGVR